ncbi:transcription termination/antitermination protein NusG [Hyphomonas sp. NPDC076900]|uniref:transcription termination/antitermination protein NusG n=1 Tax=unclassified Hyphomonas TaxID=2630699 RepID=UPI003D067C1E
MSQINPPSDHTDSVAERGYWYAVQTLSAQESVAITHLNRQKYRTFCPMISRKVRHARKTSIRHKPLFPGYVFVQLDPSRDNWHSVNGTYGVSRLIAFDGRPSPVPAAVMNALLAFSDAPLPPDDIPCGARVRIDSGAFDTWVGEICQLPDRDRAVILLDLLSRKVPVTVFRHQISRVA